MVEYLFPEDNIVDRKKIMFDEREHTVTLYYYPVKYDSRYQNQEVIESQEEWQVELDVGGFFRETYHQNEKMARLSFKLIDEKFVESSRVWHKMRKDSDKYFRKIHDELYDKIFRGKDE